MSLEALAEQVDLYDWYRCVPLSCLPPLVPAPLSGPVGFQLPVPEVLLGEGLGPLVVTGRSPPWGRLLQGQRPISVRRTARGRSSGPQTVCPALPSTGVPCPCRWLGYLGLLLLDVAICLLVLVGLIRSSKGILVG